MRKFSLCIYVSLSILSQSSLAQEKLSQVSFTKSVTQEPLSSISGTVTDSAGQGVYFYLKINGVYIDNKLASGNFHLKLAPGKFTIEFIAPNFKPAKPLIIEVAEKESFKFKVVLEAGAPLHIGNE